MKKSLTQSLAMNIFVLFDWICRSKILHFCICEMFVIQIINLKFERVRVKIGIFFIAIFNQSNSYGILMQKKLIESLSKTLANT